MVRDFIELKGSLCFRFAVRLRPNVHCTDTSWRDFQTISRSLQNHQSSHRFSKHEAWCKTSCTIKQELKQRTRQRQHTHIMTSPRLETPAPVLYPLLLEILTLTKNLWKCLVVKSRWIDYCHAVDSHVFTGGNHEVGSF